MPPGGQDASVASSAGQVEQLAEESRSVPHGRHVECAVERERRRQSRRDDLGDVHSAGVLVAAHGR